MRLFAAIVPPRDILEEVTRVVRTTSAAPPQETSRRARWRLSRRGAHAAGRPPTVGVPENELTLPVLEQMYIPITNFGNVTLGDSVKLAESLRSDASGWRRPEVRFAGGTALEFPGDESVWAKLEGDIEDLLHIGRGVPLVVQRLGFFVDRRKFRPWLSVGTITPETTAPYLERVVEALEAFRGDIWTVDSIFLMKRPPESRTPEHFEVMEEMPLAPG
jgi:2'-5' RNA ligase